jgi:hypothetical protein
MSGSVRPVEDKDIGQIADLHERLLGKREDHSSASLRNSLKTLIFENPWRSPSIPSLVYEQADGSLSGFLGVVPRPMIFNGRKVTAAISHSFMVEPGSRSSLAAIKLIRTFLAGPQDLSMAEGNNVTRKIWEGMGSSTSLIYSLSWTRPLQPARYMLSALQRRGMPAVLATPLQYLCGWIDRSSIAHRGPFKLAEPRLTSEQLDADSLCSNLAHLCTGPRLLPDYDPVSLSWLLENMQRKINGQPIRKVLLRNESQEIVGWYLYCQTVSGAWKVIQLVATEHSINDVLDHLFYQARKDGVSAISGYMAPPFFQALASRDCLFRHDGATAWMLFHSRDREISDAFHQGRVFVSRLDGEWWIGFLLE